MIDLAEVRLYELYKLWCEQHEVEPSIKDYIIWFEERYGEEDD